MKIEQELKDDDENRNEMKRYMEYEKDLKKEAIEI